MSSPASKSVHVNPSFLPHINPSKWLKASRPHLNPRFGRPHVNPNFLTNKENHIEPHSPLPKERVPQQQSVSNECAESNAGLSSPRVKYKRIGSRKLIRVANTPVKKQSAATRALVTPRKWLSKSPFHTLLHKKHAAKGPYSPEKSAAWKKGATLNNPYKLDRRPKAGIATSPSSSPAKNSVVEKKLQAPAKSSKPSKPPRRSGSKVIINVSGTRYRVLENGQKLIRIDSTSSFKASQESKSLNKSVSSLSSPLRSKTRLVNSSSSPRTPTKPLSSQRRFYLKGSEFTENSPGVLTISRNVVARRSINSAKNRSINTLLRQKRRQMATSKRTDYCVFFNKFGRCHRQPSCPFVHDASRVRVCPQFVLGECHDRDCPLSHRLAPNQNMPVCSFFLQGICARDNCSYRHVKVAQNAPICTHFLKGRCNKGEECKLRHVRICPEFEANGKCSRGKTCPWPHQCRGSKKKNVPSKPQRSTAHSVKKNEIKTDGEHRVRNDDTRGKFDNKSENQSSGISGRYFDAPSAKRKLDVTDDSEMEVKKPRINAGENEHNFSDGAEEDTSNVRKRPSLGSLPSFIALDKYSSGEENSEEDKPEFQERLV